MYGEEKAPCLPCCCCVSHSFSASHGRKIRKMRACSSPANQKQSAAIRSNRGRRQIELIPCQPCCSVGYCSLRLHLVGMLQSMCQENCRPKVATERRRRNGDMKRRRPRPSSHRLPLAFLVVTLSLLSMCPHRIMRSAEAFSPSARPAGTICARSARPARPATFRCADEAYRRRSSTLLCAATGGGGGDDDNINNNNGRRGGGNGGGGGGGNNRDDGQGENGDNEDDGLGEDTGFMPLDSSRRHQTQSAGTNSHNANTLRLFGGGLLSLILHPTTKARTTALHLASSTMDSSSTRKSLVAVLLAHHTQLSTVAKNHFSSATIALGKSSAWYMTMLETHPLVTKCVTGGIIGFLGDLGAQCFAHRLEEGGESGDGHKAGINSRERSQGSIVAAANSLNHKSASMQFDLRRGMSVLVSSMFFSGPIMHYSYDLFERLLPVSKMPKGFRTIASSAHVMADALILDSLFVASSMLVTGLLEGYNLREDIVPQFQTDYASTLRMSWGMSAVIAPYQLCCFRFLPASLRVLSINLSDVAWDGVVSYKNHLSRAAAGAVPMADVVEGLERPVKDDKMG